MENAHLRAEGPPDSQSSDPTSQVQQSAPGQSSRHLLRPPHSSPISSPPPPPTHTHSGNYILLLPLASLSWGREGAGEEDDRKGWGRGKTVPAFPARHPHPNSATITWCLEWEVGEEARLFGCSESPVVPSFSAVNSGDAALCPGA